MLSGNIKGSVDRTPKGPEPERRLFEHVVIHYAGQEKLSIINCIEGKKSQIRPSENPMNETPWIAICANLVRNTINYAVEIPERT